MIEQHQKQLAAYKLAQGRLGLKEIAGKQHNKEIVDFFAAVGHGWVKDDETAWCAAFVGAMLNEAGLTSTKALNARSYLDWGVEVPLDEAREGDIVVFWRGSPDAATGHVGFFEAETDKTIRVLGGNQSNSVSVAGYKKERLLSVRRMPRRLHPMPPMPEPANDKPKSLIDAIVGIIMAFISSLKLGKR